MGQLNREPACGPVQGKQSLEAGLRTLLGSGRQYDMVSLTAAAVSPGVRNARLEAGLSLLRPGGVLLLHDVLPPPAAGAGPHTMDYDPTRWPQSPRIVMRCAPRASNGPNRLGLCALQARPPATPTGTGSRRFTRNSGRTRAGCPRPQCVSHPAFRCVSAAIRWVCTERSVQARCPPVPKHRLDAFISDSPGPLSPNIYSAVRVACLTSDVVFAGTPSPHTFIFSVENDVRKDSYRRHWRRNRLLRSLPTLTSVRILTDSVLQREK